MGCAAFYTAGASPRLTVNVKNFIFIFHYEIISCEAFHFVPAAQAERAKLVPYDVVLALLQFRTSA